MASKKNTTSTTSTTSAAEMMQTMQQMMQAMQTMAERIAAMESAAVVTETAKAAKPSKGAKAAKAAKPEPTKDERRAKVEAANAAILATVPKGNRARVRAILKRVHEAGYPYARLVTNKNHQLDALRVVAGWLPDEQSHGKDLAFIACQTKQAETFAAKRDEATKRGAKKPAQPLGVFVWSPAHGGQLYARGIFGKPTDN